MYPRTTRFVDVAFDCIRCHLGFFRLAVLGYALVREKLVHCLDTPNVNVAFLVMHIIGQDTQLLVCEIVGSTMFARCSSALVTI